MNRYLSCNSAYIACLMQQKHGRCLLHFYDYICFRIIKISAIDSLESFYNLVRNGKWLLHACISSHVSRGNNYINDSAMPLLLCQLMLLIQMYLLKCLMYLIKSITNIGDDKFYSHFSFSYKKCSPCKAKALRPFYLVQNHLRHSSKHFYHPYLGYNNEMEILLNKVKIPASVYTLDSSMIKWRNTKLCLINRKVGK